jgi:hypothetical protein
MPRIESFREPRPRYPTLRVIGFFCTLFGVILIGIGAGLMLLAGLQALAGAGGPLPAPLSVLAGYALLWSFGILFSGLQMLAVGAFLRLMIHVEENTRVSAQVLDRIRSRLDANPEGIEPLFES